MDIFTQPFDAIAPPSISEAFLRGLARLAFNRLAETHSDLHPPADLGSWLDRVAAILVTNIASGRFQSARHYQPASLAADAQLLNYAEQIAVELLHEEVRIEALRRGDTLVWQPVIQRLERLAYYGLGPHGREDWAAWEARCLASQTCSDLWVWLQDHPYPFDVPFDRWSAAALNNRLLEVARKYTSEAARRGPSLDQVLPDHAEKKTYGGRLVDRSLETWLEQSANREALLQAMARLPKRQAQIIQLWYFAQWPADEIATEMDTTVGNVYVLRFRAVQNLREIVLRDERLGLSDALSMLESETRRSTPQSELQEVRP